MSDPNSDIYRWSTVSDPNSDIYCWSSDDESRGKDPVRVDGPIDISSFPSDGGLSTGIDKSRGACADRTLIEAFVKMDIIEAFVKIDKMADRLGLPNTVKDRAKGIYLRLIEISIRKKIQDPILAAGLHIACSHESVPRSLKEMITPASGMKMKNVGRAKKHIKRYLREHRRTMMEPTDSIHKVDEFEDRKRDFVNFDF